MQKGNIGVTTDNIFPIIKKFLYSDHEIFLRELVSNAVDATQKLKTLSSVGEFKGELGDLFVEVKVNKEAGTLTISDRGIGMTEEEIDQKLTDYFKTHDALTRSQFEVLCTQVKSTAHRILQKLVKDGKLKNVSTKQHPVYMPDNLYNKGMVEK